MSARRVTGLHLKIKRIRAELKIRHVAHMMGLSPQRVSAIEQLYRVTPEMKIRYLTALEYAIEARTMGTLESPLLQDSQPEEGYDPRGLLVRFDQPYKVGVMTGIDREMKDA